MYAADEDNEPTEGEEKEEAYYLSNEVLYTSPKESRYIICSLCGLFKHHMNMV